MPVTIDLYLDHQLCFPIIIISSISISIISIIIIIIGAAMITF